MARGTCEAVWPLLSALIDGELSEEERRTVEAHLAVCDECRARLCEYHAIGRAVGSLPPVEPPADLRRLFRQRLKLTDNAGEPEPEDTGHPVPESYGQRDESQHA